MDKYLNRETRKWLYLIAIPVLGLLTFKGAVAADEAVMWLAVIGAVLVPGVALANLTPKPPVDEDGA